MARMLPQYNTKIFTDIFPDFSSFKDCFDNDFDSYAKDCIPWDYLRTLYWLLFSRYGFNPIVNLTEDLFKARVVAITFQKGPTWVRRLQIQSDLRDLTDEELITGAKTILNKAMHDETEPGTDTDTELPYVNAQDVSKIKRSKIDAYSYLNDVLKTDVSQEFIDSYAKLFSKFVTPNITFIYVDEEEEEEDN